MDCTFFLFLLLGILLTVSFVRSFAPFLWWQVILFLFWFVLSFSFYSCANKKFVACILMHGNHLVIFFYVLDCTFSLSLLLAQIKKEKKYQKEKEISAAV